MFPPDSPLVAAVVPAPSHEARRNGVRPDMLLLHYTGMTSGPAALERLTSGSHGVSSHYFVDLDGRILQLVAERERAWHAGQAAWAGETDINSCSIGIEIVNPGHDYGYPDFPDAQIEAVIALCRDVVARNAIVPARVLAHSDVAPGRKQDPGEKFPWGRLAAAGVGFWVAPVPVREGPVLAPGDQGVAVTELQAALADVGYGLTASGVYDDATRDVVMAFQRHFRPALVDGRADISTIETLRLFSAVATPPQA
jgi:N-acetylmuramoyl-L-alanine amidase